MTIFEIAIITSFLIYVFVMLLAVRRSNNQKSFPEEEVAEVMIILAEEGSKEAAEWLRKHGYEREGD